MNHFSLFFCAFAAMTCQPRSESLSVLAQEISPEMAEFTEWRELYQNSGVAVLGPEVLDKDLTCLWIRNDGIKGSRYRTTFFTNPSGKVEIFSTNTHFWNKKVFAVRENDFIAEKKWGNSLGTFAVRKVNNLRFMAEISFDGNVIYYINCVENREQDPSDVFGQIILESDTIVYLDSSGNEIQSSSGIDVLAKEDGPHGIAYGDGIFTVVNSYSNTTYFFDRLGRIAYERLSSSDMRRAIFPETVAFGSGVFVTTNYVDKSLSFLQLPQKADGTRNPIGDVEEIRRVFTRDESPVHVAYGGGLFAVVFDGSVRFYDPNGNLKEQVRMPNGPNSVIYGDGVFAVTNSRSHSVSVLTVEGVHLRDVPVGSAPRGIAFGDGVFAAASTGNHSMTFFKADGTIVAQDVSLGRRLPGESNVYSIAYGNGNFLVANLVRGKPEAGNIDIFRFNQMAETIDNIVLDKFVGAHPLANAFAK